MDERGQKKSAVIVGDGMWERAFILEILERETGAFLIAADGAARFLYENGKILPDLLVGDFDSVDQESLCFYESQHVMMKRLPREKDETDAESALLLAIEMGCERVLMLGMTGKRLDHFWGNVQLLALAVEKNVEACIMDQQNRISVLAGDTVLKKKDAFGTYFSLFPLGGPVEHLSVQGAKYPLQDYLLRPDITRTVSNEIEEERVRITFPRGYVILMETKDYSKEK